MILYNIYFCVIYNFSILGHFSQVVWRDTKEMGVGMISKQEGDVWTIIIVANYYPAGNCEGHFSANVSPPHCQ